MPRMRYNGAVNGVLPHVHGGGWDDSVYLAYFAGRMAGNIAIDEEALRFFFSLLSRQGEKDVSESIFRYLASLGYDEESGRRAGIRNIGSILEDVKSPDVHRTCGEIILELLDTPESFDLIEKGGTHMLSQVKECPKLWVRSRFEAGTLAGSGVVFPCGPRGGAGPLTECILRSCRRYAAETPPLCERPSRRG